MIFQFSQLIGVLYKNYLWKKRNSLSILASILLPAALCITLYFVVSGTYRYPSCIIEEKHLQSSGIFRFFHDLVCNFNNTCSNIYKYEDYQFSNSSFYKALAQFLELMEIGYYGNFIKGWYYDYDKSANFAKYFYEVYDNLWPVLKRYDYANDKVSRFRFFVGLLCGNDSDLMKLFDVYANSSLSNIFGADRMTRLARTCQLFDLTLPLNMTPQVYTIFMEKVKPFINGKIYFVAKNEFQDEIIMKFNETFQTIEYLKKSLILYDKVFIETYLVKLFFKGYLKAFRNSITCKLFWCERALKDLEEDKIKSFFRYFARYTNTFASVFDCFELNRLQRISRVEDIKENEIKKMFAYIEFGDNTNSSFLNYTIRMPKNRMDKTFKYRVLDPQFNYNQRMDFFSDFKMYSSGFLFLQETIDRAFIQIITKQTLDTGVTLQHFPYPCYVSETLLRSSGDQCIFCFVMLWLFQFCMTVFAIVYEKDIRQREFLRLSGLRNYMHWIGWYISEFIFYFALILMLLIVLSIVNILKFTSTVFLFCLFLIYSFALLNQALLITSFFTNATLASIYAGILYVAFCTLQFIILKYEETIPNFVCYFLSIFCQTAISNILKMVVRYNIAFMHNGFWNLFSNDINLHSGLLTGNFLLILVMDIFLYLILFWYIDACIAGKYGKNKPFYYPVTKYYYVQKSKPDIDSKFSIAKQIKIDEKYYEPNDNNLNRYVIFENVTKMLVSKHKYILNDFSAEFCNNQISAILGKNDSGKSAIASILTGYDSNYKGNVYINHYKLSKISERADDTIGYCPQYNILWNDLSIREHIFIFCRIRNVYFENFDYYLKGLLTKNFLRESSDTLIKDLNPSNRRKLSLIIAFIGQPNLIIIDEPTYGVDQGFFWEIWHMIEKQKSTNKCIIVTTNSLIEADMLSDRIALISEGQLRAMGSTQYLRTVFSTGYITVASSNLDQYKNVFDKETGLNYLISLKLGEYDQLTSSYDPSAVANINLFMNILGTVDEVDNEELSKNPKKFQRILKGNMPDITDFRGQFKMLFIHRVKLTKHKYSMFIGQFFFPMLVMSLFMVFNLFSSFHELPSMLIHPWLMINPVRKYDLISFYSKLSSSKYTLESKFVDMYRSDLGESGLRCMNLNKSMIPSYPCITNNSTSNWTESPYYLDNCIGDCSCSTGFQMCFAKHKGGPIPSSRYMASTDLLLNLTSYNLTNFILKNFQAYRGRMFGGFEFLFEDHYMFSARMVCRSTIFQQIRVFLPDDPALLFVENAKLFLYRIKPLTSYTRIWFYNKGYFSAAAYLNIYSNLLLRIFAQISQPTINPHEYGIAVNYHPIEDHSVDLDDDKVEKVTNIIYSVFYAACIGTVTSSFMIFTVEERVTGVKKFKISNNVNLLTYWVVMFVFDYLVYSIYIVLFVLLTVIFGLYQFISIPNMLAFAFLLIFYGTAKITNNYLFSFFYQKESYAFATSNALAILISSLSAVYTASVDNIVHFDPSQVYLQQSVHRIFVWLPSYNLCRGFIDLFIHNSDYIHYKKPYNALDIDVTGLEIIALVSLTFIQIFLLIIIEIVLHYAFRIYEKEKFITDFDWEQLKKHGLLPQSANQEYIMINAGALPLTDKEKEEAKYNTMIIVPKNLFKVSKKILPNPKPA